MLLDVPWIRNSAEPLQTILNHEKAVDFAVFGVAMFIGWFYYTAGYYKAEVIYTVSKEGYTLDRVVIYAKPVRIEGKYAIRLKSKEDRPYGDFSEVLREEFGVTYYDPNKVKRRCSEDCFIVIDAGVVELKPNVMIKKEIHLKALTAEEPIEFEVTLYPVKGGWVIHVGNTKNVIDYSS